MTSRSMDGYLERIRGARNSLHYDVVEREAGTVTSVGDSVALVSGLRGARLDELLVIDDRVRALALDLQPEALGAVILDASSDVAVGSPVTATGKIASVPVGESLLGRAVDPLGRPLDGGPPLDATSVWPAERPAPAIWEREPITEPLLTGLMVIDALFPVGRGQRQLIMGDRGSGKSTVAVDAVINQRNQGVRCVYVSIGQMTSSVVTLRRTLESAGALDHTVLVVGHSEAPPGLRFLAPYAGCSIAEYFRDRGEDALVVFDDLTAHAVAYRELSLLLGRPPGREAYPGDVFFIHSRLLERATRLSRERGGGSLTALPLAETRAGRISDFIPTNLISITDGQLYLDSAQFDRGFKPAVDVGVSVSRVGGKTQRAAMKDVAGRLRLDIARFRDVEVFARFGARVEEQTKQTLTRGARARELLKQGPADLYPLGEQVALLLMLRAGAFDDLAIAEVAPTAHRFRGLLRADLPEVLAALDPGPAPSNAEDLMRPVFNTARSPP